ncbi:MAG TPA: hypothetical protein VFQ85_10520 [Mycobacteriales bacterium]|jgi:hypothetical protein|nr:hypothetical protein [Mycobacteriales bacterium]
MSLRLTLLGAAAAVAVLAPAQANAGLVSCGTKIQQVCNTLNSRVCPIDTRTQMLCAVVY